LETRTIGTWALLVFKEGHCLKRHAKNGDQSSEYLSQDATRMVKLLKLTGCTSDSALMVAAKKSKQNIILLKKGIFISYR
jgi:hypothetical protein